MFVRPGEPEAGKQEGAEEERRECEIGGRLRPEK